MKDDKTHLSLNRNEDDKTVILSDIKSNKDTDKTVIQSSVSEDKTVVISHQGNEEDPSSFSSAFEENNLNRLGVGSLINKRFLLDKQLGFGGMGAVYRALDKRKQEADDETPYIAIKLLGEDFKNHPKAFITLQRETKKTQQLAHPNIVTVHDFDRDGDLVYMTMEELKGQNLDEFIKAHAASFIDTKQALSIIKNIASGLAYAHSKGIVHSDLKPGNIFVTEEGQVKILDFGIARVVEDNADANRFDAGELGALSPCYASVEMINHLAPDPKDDIYALGIIACELLTGTHPYQREMATDAVQQNLKPDIPGVGRMLRAVLESAVTHDLAKRVESCDAFIRKLDFATRGYKKWLAGGVLAICLIISNLVYLNIAKEPELSLSDLSVTQQQEFAGFMAEASTAMRFGDVNGALFYMDKAYAIHSSNSEISDFVEQVIAKVEANIAAQSVESQEVQAIIETLGEYAVFQNEKWQDALKTLGE